MKVSRLFYLLAAIVMIGSTAHAQTITQVVDEPAILALTGDTDTDPRSLAIDGAGNLYFFDSEPEVNSIFVFDGTDLTTYVTAAELATAIGASAVGDIDDMVASSAGVLFAIVRDDAFNENVVRVPSAGVAELMVSTANGAAETFAIDYDEINDRVVVATDDPFGTPSILGLFTVPATATDTTPTPFALASDIVQTGVTPSTTSTTVWGPSDLVVLSDGSVIVANGFGEGDADGDLIQISEDGSTITPYMDAALILSSTGVTNTSFGDTFIESATGLLTDEILLYQTSGEAFIVRVDGTSGVLIADENEIEGATGGTSLGTDGNGFAVADGCAYLPPNGGGIEGIISICGADVPVELGTFQLQ